MQSLTKCAHLSQHALTKHHGHLLRASGFTKLGSVPRSFESWEPIGMTRLVGSFCPARTLTGRLSSGRPEIPGIPVARRSTLAAVSREALSTSTSWREALAHMETALSFARTYSLPSRSGDQESLTATQSWAQQSANTLSPDFSELELRMGAMQYAHGLIQTPQVIAHVRSRRKPLLSAAYLSYISSHLKTPSSTASGK